MAILGTYLNQPDLYLVVDLNGVAGFQFGADLAIELNVGTAHIANLSTADFI
jgi:hypothetical protein